MPAFRGTGPIGSVAGVLRTPRTQVEQTAVVCTIFNIYRLQPSNSVLGERCTREGCGNRPRNVFSRTPNKRTPLYFHCAAQTLGLGKQAVSADNLNNLNLLPRSTKKKESTTVVCCRDKTLPADRTKAHDHRLRRCNNNLYNMQRGKTGR